MSKIRRRALFSLSLGIFCPFSWRLCTSICCMRDMCLLKINRAVGVFPPCPPEPCIAGKIYPWELTHSWAIPRRGLYKSLKYSPPEKLRGGGYKYFSFVILYVYYSLNISNPSNYNTYLYTRADTEFAPGGGGLSRREASRKFFLGGQILGHLNLNPPPPLS